MNKSTKLAGAGITLIVGSLLSVAPVALGADVQPAKVCLEDTPLGSCGITTTTTLPGGSGDEVAVYVPEILRGDAKDHPNYGQITPEFRGDAKDHPDYGQITPNHYSRVGRHDSVGGNYAV